MDDEQNKNNSTYPNPNLTQPTYPNQNLNASTQRDTANSAIDSIYLLSDENESIKFNKINLSKLSPLVNGMLELSPSPNLNKDNDTINISSEFLNNSTHDDSNQQLSMKGINSDTLKKISFWIDNHCSDVSNSTNDSECSYREPSTEAELKKYVFNEWESKFFNNMNSQSLLELVTASDFLGIQFLTESCCLAIANMINGKKPDEIRAAFNIINDLSDREIKKIKAENDWDNLFHNL